MDAKLKKSIKKGLRISLAISIVTFLLILGLTVEKETLKALERLRPLIFFALFFFWGSFVFLDGYRLHLFAKTNKLKLPLKRAVEIILIGYFFAAVTPFQTGGFPFQIYLFRKEGINPGKGTAILAMRGISIYGITYLLTPFIFLQFSSIARSGIIKLLLHYLFVFLIVLFLFLFLTVLKPEKGEQLLEKFKPHLNKKIINALEVFFTEVEEFKISFSNSTKSKESLKNLFYALLVSIFAYLNYIGLSPLILYGLGIENINPLMVMQVQIVLMALLLFIPTPGAGGIAEMGGVALYSLVCPKYLLGVFVVLWRFFTFYLSAIVGGILALKEF